MKIFPKIFFFIIIFFGIFGLAKSSKAADVVVNQNDVQQKIEAFGGNYVFYHYGQSVADYTFNNLNPGHARFQMNLSEWEPVNENNNPLVFNWALFLDSDDVHDDFLEIQKFDNKGIPIVLSIWDVPNWMVSNPSNAEQRIIPAEKYDEVIESIAAFLIRSRDQYGVEIPYISFNEPEIGVKVIFSSAQMANFIKKAGARFSSLGLNTKWLTGDTAHAYSLVSYATPILQDATARQYLGPVSFHSWNSWSVSDMEGIYTLAKQYGLPVWCEEIGTSPYADFSASSTWSFALDLAKMYHLILKYSRATVLDYWQYGGSYALVGSDGTTYPSFYAVKQLADNFPSGTDIVETSSNDSEVLALAGKKSSAGNLALHLVNTGSAKSVNISGIPAGNFALIRTSASEKMQVVGNYSTSNGNLSLSLLASSINTLYQIQSPVPTFQNLTIRARGSNASGWPNMEIWVDGTRVINNTTVSSATYTNYNFSISNNAQKIDIVFTNDYYNSTTNEDRNLFVDYVTYKGVTIQSESSGVILDKGNGTAAFDGINTIPGQESILWNAALRFNVLSDTTPPAAPSGLNVQ